MQQIYVLIVSFNENKMFCAIFSITCRCGCKKQEFTKKAGTVPILLRQTHDYKIFHYKFLLKSLD
jgi:hypothetical protein